MTSRFLPASILLACVCAPGQTGLYGPVTAHPKAGSAAPDLTFSKALSTPDGTAWSHGNLAGRTTVLAFFPDTTDNLEAVTQWNKAVDQFAGKPVQFVWITGEDEQKVVPWLAQHPIKGWVLEDPAGATGSAYGMTVPENVIVGPDGKIAGFFAGLALAGPTIRAVQDGRATTVRPTRATRKAFVAAKKLLLDAEPRSMPVPEEHRPSFAPSYAVHVTASAGDEHSSARSEDFWSLRGFTLKEAIVELYGFPAPRLRMPEALDTAQHYDIDLVLPAPENRGKMRERMEVGLLEHFHLAATRNSRLVPVYVLTAQNGSHPTQAKRPGNAFEVESVETPGQTDDWKPLRLEAVRGVASQGTMEDFCRQFEAELDTPVVDETHLKGDFTISIKAEDTDRNDFLERLREEAGLILTQGERTLEILEITQIGA